MSELFGRIARKVEGWVGSPFAFALAISLIVAWAVTGPYFGWSDTHQLVINTATTIVTFLMVFLIQNAQARDTRAMHLKLDELIRATENASNKIILSEEMTDGQIARERDALAQLAEERTS